MWAASLSSPSKAEGWLWRGRDLVQTQALPSRDRPSWERWETRRWGECELAGGTASPGAYILPHRAALGTFKPRSPRGTAWGRAPLGSAAGDTGLLCWSSRTQAPSKPSSHLPPAEGLPSDAPPRLLLSSRGVASLQWGGCRDPAWWQLGCGWGRKDALRVSSWSAVVPPQRRAACTRAPPSSIQGHRGLGPHCWATRENRSSSRVDFWDFSEVFSSC